MYMICVNIQTRNDNAAAVPGHFCWHRSCAPGPRGAFIKPMPASLYDPAKAAFPCLVQPKLNGVRCLFDGKTARTRNGNQHIKAVQSLLSGIITGGAVLDGELYADGWSFEQIVSAVKKDQPLTAKLHYYVYDAIFEDDPSFTERYERLEKIVAANPATPLVLLRTLPCKDEDQLHVNHDSFKQDGFEGLIYRSSKGRYSSKPTPNLMKLKSFIDSEFIIMGFDEGTGRCAGTPIFLCQSENGRKFRVSMKGTLDYRRRLWAQRESLIGKPLTVKYQDITPRGAPRFPVGLAIRDYEGTPATAVIEGHCKYGIKYKIELHF